MVEVSSRRLRGNAASLLDAHLTIANVIDQGRSIMPATE
jgi:hypothetical protein